MEFSRSFLFPYIANLSFFLFFSEVEPVSVWVSVLADDGSGLRTLSVSLIPCMMLHSLPTWDGKLSAQDLKDSSGSL